MFSSDTSELRTKGKKKLYLSFSVCIEGVGDREEQKASASACKRPSCSFIHNEHGLSSERPLLISPPLLLQARALSAHHRALPPSASHLRRLDTRDKRSRNKKKSYRDRGYIISLPIHSSTVGYIIIQINAVLK